MAFSNVDKLNAQVALSMPQSQYEMRFIDPATYKAIVAMTGTPVPDYVDLRSSESRVLQINTPHRDVRSVGTARSHNHTGPVGSADEETLIWTIAADSTSHTLKQGENSTYALTKMINSDVTNMGINIVNSLEGKAQDFIFANMTQVNPSTTGGSFDATDDVFQITESTDGEDIAQITDMVMNELAFKGQMTVFCTPVAWNKFKKLDAQGSANATNTTFAFGNLVFVKSIGLEGATRFGGLNASAGYPKGAWITVPTGALAALDWTPQLNRSNYSDSEGTYSTLSLPNIDTTVAMHSYSERADGSSTGGQTQDVLTQLQMSVDTSFFDAMISETLTTAVVGFVLV